MEKLYHIDYYVSKDEQHMMFAVLHENPMYVFFFDEKKKRWIYGGCSFEITKDFRPVEKIEKEVVVINTMGKTAERAFKKIGFEIEKEKVKRKDRVDELVNGLIDFAISHYKNGIKKEVVLNLTAKELDEAFNCGYVELIDLCYEKYLKRKQNGKYKDIEITKKDDDYIIKISEEVIKELN